MTLMNNLQKTLIWSMIAIAVLSAGLVGSLWLFQEYTRYAAEVRSMREDFLAQQKASIKKEVDAVIDFIDYQRSTTEETLKRQTKDRVYRAVAVAENMYNTYRDSRTDADIKVMIREALRPVRFFSGQDYYFIYDMQGNNVLLPFSPQLEGRNLWDLQDSKGQYTIRRMVALMREHGEGFLEWYWFKPGETSTMSRKIGFSKVFAPFDWWIGTGEYIEDVEEQIKHQTLERIKNIRFGQDGYIFVTDFEGNNLAHVDETLIGRNQLEYRDSNGVPVVRELIRLGQQEGGGFLRYVSNIRPTTGQPAEKIGYARAIGPWRWMVGSGLYTDEINEKIEQQRAALITKITRSLASVVAILLLAFAFIATVLRYVTGRITGNMLLFSAFFERAATDASRIDEETVHFSEFKSLARAANEMVEVRIRAAASIERLEQQLVRSRKMEALGVLAGGVAHDLNNVLSAVVGYPDFILANLPATDPNRRYIEKIQASGIKAADIVQDLLTLARRGVVQQVVLDLNAVIEQYLASPEHIKLRTGHPDVRVEVSLAPDLLLLKGSPVHLQKTVMNLVVNAAEAQPNGGVIHIGTENRYIDMPLRGYDRIEEGDYVVLTVADEGIGIPESDLEQIFEPFFSKKTLGRSGTGLGMAVVWGAVQDHLGYITVSTAEDRGTLFELYFPATQDKLGSALASDSLDDYQGSGQAILLVDDSGEQRELAKAMLDQLGYRTSTATSGEEALQLLAEQSFALLILDMLMGAGMDGLDTYRQALELNPRQQAIIVSGYAATDRVQQAMQLGVRRFVKKPYTLRRLAEAVRETLQPSADRG